VILDKGICEVYRMEDISEPGGMPKEELVKIHESWFGELDFGSNPEYETQHREDVGVAARIRIHQNREITNLHAVKLSTEPDKRYEVTRVYHGRDDESGELISDLSLKAVT
jgi:head-tail adaptor